MSSINSPENLETYSLLWLDNYANSSSDNRRAQQQLQKLIPHLLTFEDDYQCFQYLTNLSINDRIILIASGRFGRMLVPRIVQFRQITSIYIYCMDKRANEQWSKQYSKVNKVVTRLNELIQSIEHDYTQQYSSQINECLSMNIFNTTKSSSDEFLRFQLLIDGLIRLKSCELTDRSELISFCKQYYQSNPSELMMIKEFQCNYQSSNALDWLIRPTFLSRLLTKAFRNENLDLLYKFRFFLRHLAFQLGQSSPSTSICVYRSQLLTKEEIHLVKSSIGKIISLNTFVRANYDENQCRSWLNSKNDLEKVLWVIRIDSKLRCIRPYGNIQSKIREILFMIGSIFSLDEIFIDNEQIWTIKLTLRSLEHVPQLKSELSFSELNLFQFGQLLYRLGKYEQCQKYYCHYLNQLPDNHPDLSSCYQHLGLLAEIKKQFPHSLKWFRKALKTCQTNQHAPIHNSIANVYSKMNEYTRAIKSYEKAMTYFETDDNNNHHHHHQSIITCWNNIGAMHDMKKDYNQALECYNKALTISNKNQDSETIFIWRNIGNTYELAKDYKQAAKSYENALKLIDKSSSSSVDEIYIKDIQTSLRRVSLKV